MKIEFQSTKKLVDRGTETMEIWHSEPLAHSGCQCEILKPPKQLIDSSTQYEPSEEISKKSETIIEENKKDKQINNNENEDEIFSISDG